MSDYLRIQKGSNEYVPSSVVDIDFIDEVPSDQNLGWIEQTDEEMFAATPDIESFADVFPQHMVPRSQWKERIDRIWRMMRATTVQIVSQGQEGSCVGFSCTQALETTLTRRFGRRHWVDLSGVSLYKRIGRTASSGAYIPDGIKEIQERGVLPVNSAVNIQNYQHTHPRTGFSRTLPSGWTTTAKLFRASRVATCRGAEEIFSALMGGFCGVVGRSRHAIPYVYPQYSGNTFYCVYANSWGSSWGSNGGFGFDSERTFGSLTMYVILDVVTRPDINILPLAS
jgi:hypothetical protein